MKVTLTFDRKYDVDKDDAKIMFSIGNKRSLGSSPALATCETSQVLLAGVSGGFSRGSPVFAPPTDWPVSYELK